MDYCHRLLILHTLTIEEQWRGQGLGLLAIDTLFRIVGEFELCIIKPFPLQFSGKVTDENRQEFKVAQGKLQRYWARLGFKPIPKHREFYVLDPRMKQPSVTEFMQQRRAANA